MRLDINLATRPYEDAREFWGRWGTGIGLLAVVTLVLIGWTLRSWSAAGRDRQNIAQLQQQIATRDQSQFLNGLIRRKAFSWTRVFEDLEQVMPSNLHVTSLRPEFNEQNSMQLDMRVVGDTRAAALELVHRMETSKHFQGAQLISEGASSETGSGVTASVIATYIPDAANGSGK